MVGAVAIRSVFTDETALSLYSKNFLPERYCQPVSEAPLPPEIVAERETISDLDSLGYDRFGRMNRIRSKGVFVDSYH